MSKQLNLQVRMDKEDKEAAEAVFEVLGMTTSQAIKIFLRQVVLNNALPFKVAIPQPNQETLEAIQEIQAMIDGKVESKGMSYKEFIDLQRNL